MTSSQFDIRPACDSDFSEIAALLKEVGLLTEGLVQGMPDLYVAEIDGAIIGCAALESDESFGLLRSVGILPAAQRGGIGRQLVDAIHARAGDLGLESVYLLTTTAEEYFPRFGYERVERTEIPKLVTNTAEFSTCSAAGAAILKKKIRRQVGQ